MTLQSQARDVAWAGYVWPKGRLGNWTQGKIIGGVETRRVRREWEHASRILLVHTPGKVGSMAMVAALAASKRTGDAIFHTHRINPDNLTGVAAERAVLAPRRTWYTAAFLGAHLRADHNKEVVVLAAVRDPVERSISAFLQNVERYSESGRPITSSSRIDADDLNRQFVAHFDHWAITRWVEMELNAMFGVDVFGTPFDHVAGYQIETSRHLTVGVIRHDQFGAALTPFIESTTGLHAPQVGRVNDSNAKSYGGLYRRMRESIRVPRPLLEEIYDSAYARHFFTDAERERAVVRWS